MNLESVLKQSNQNLQDLINITKQDIDDIKKANSQKLFDRNDQKDLLVKSFVAKKASIDQSLVARVENAKDKKLENVLSKNENELLEKLKNNLLELKQVNKDYARFVSVVGEFYTSLIDELFIFEEDGYSKKVPKLANFIEVRV